MSRCLRFAAIFIQLPSPPVFAWLNYPVSKGLSPAQFALVLLLLANAAYSQDLEPRTYTNIPVGQNFFGLGYAYSDGEINPSPSVPIKSAELTIEGPVAAYVRSLDLWGKAGKIELSWARLCFEGSAEFQGKKVRGDRCGTADPNLGLSYLFYGAPAMSLSELRKTPPRRVIGASLKVSPPLGDYNNENLINSGANRWTFKPEIGISNVYGKWSIDAAFAVRLFTDNDRYAGHSTLEQDPLYQVQTHLIYSLPKGRWISLNGNYFWGAGQRKTGSRAMIDSRTHAWVLPWLGRSMPNTR